MGLSLAVGVVSLAVAQDVKVTPASVPATGRATAVASIGQFGRYAILADGPQGTAVQVVERMTGPGVSAGTPGFTDGRVDLFLDAGDVQIVATSDSAGTGTVKLTARRFVETAPSSEELPELRLAEGALHDFEQRTWWIRIPERRSVAIEVGGRSLADLRLWQDGSWLVDASPRCAEATPTRGKPETTCALVTALEPGWYAVTAYGGPAKAWTAKTDASPLHARWGLPTLPPAGRESHVVSPFGVDRYLVPTGPSSFSLELPVRADASLMVASYSADAPFPTWGSTGTISDESRVPQTTVSSSGGQRVLTVRGEAGQPYTVTWFSPISTVSGLPKAGPSFVATLAAGAPEDRADATGMIVPNRDPVTGAGQAPLAMTTIAVAPGSPYRRRFYADHAVVLQVSAAAGRYDIAVTSTSAKGASIVVEPLLINRPKGYERPEPVKGGGSFDLPAQAAVTVYPDEAGVIDLAITPSWGSKGELRAPIAAVEFPSVDLASHPFGYTLYAPDLGVPVGVIVRPLPVNLADALPVSLRPLEEVSVQVTVPARGPLQARLEDGTDAELAVDGGAYATSAMVEAGDHVVKVRQGGATTRTASLAWTPPSRVAGPLPKVPPATIAGLPKFPPVTIGTPLPTDFAPSQLRTWSLDVAEPGLYAVTTTGLLATSGTMRTRTNTHLLAASQNGVARNFAVSHYLGTGDYQVSTQVEGLSTGHAALVVSKQVVREGGGLVDGVPARVSLAAGEGALYTFHVERAGMYTLRTVTPGRPVYARLEDGDGWPLRAPDAEASFRGWLEAGDYRWMLLPDEVATKRITALDREPDPVAREGHGPFASPIDTSASHTWREPQTGPRAPDVWTFDLPAASRVTIAVDGEMTGALFGPSGKLDQLVVGRPLEVDLAAGSYHLEVVNARKNDAVPYSLTVSSAALLAGGRREVWGAVDVPVSIGQAGDYVFTSLGDADVRAELLDAAGAVVAASDDRPDDWNFRIAAKLAPGRYTLAVRPVGGEGATTVRLAQAAERDGGSLALGVATDVGSGARLSVEPGRDGVLVVGARSRENVMVAIEADEGDGFRVVATAEGTSPVAAAGLERDALGWRVRVAAIDGRGQEVTVRADVATGPLLGEGERTLASLGKGLPAGVVGLRDVAPGTFRVSDGTLACAPDCAPHDGVVAADAAVWLVGAPGTRVRAERFVLDDRSPGVPLDRPATVDLVPHVGPVLVVARATAGVPSVSFGGPVAYGPGSAVAVSLGGSPTVALSAAVSAPGAKAHLERYAYPAPIAGGLGYGTRDGVVAARGAVAWTHPAGFADLRVTLGEGLVAVLADERGAVSVLSALDGPATHVVPHCAAKITLLSTADAPVPYTIEANRSSGAAAQLANGVPWEGLTSGEIVHLPVTGTGVLHVRGAVSASANGVASDSELRFDAPGEVVLATGRGAVVAWLGDAGLMGKDDATFSAASGDALLVRARGPAVFTAKRADGSLDVRVVTEGQPVVFGVQGGAEVRARGLFGARGPTLGDVQLLTASPLSEGLGAPVLLGPGDARAFSFETTGEDGAVGLGLAADAEHVRALLFDAGGRLVAQGASLMPVLPRGRWLLVVVADEGAAPVTVRPALVGRDRPGDGPPLAIVESYLP